MTIIYGPYEPPPSTAAPPEHAFEAGPPLRELPASAAPIKPPSSVGPLLCVLGLGMALVGMFALPLEHYFTGWGRDIGYQHVRNAVVDVADPSYPAYQGPVANYASGLARWWWTTGTLLAAAVLIVMTGAVSVVQKARFRSLVGATTSLIALGTGVLFYLALRQTADYRHFVIYGSNTYSMYRAAGLGTWFGFAGLAALVIGGLRSSGLTGRRDARHARSCENDGDEWGRSAER